MGGLRLQEARVSEARGTSRGGQIGRQEMEDDFNERERSGNVGV